MAPANPNGLLLWVLGAAGVFLLYSAVKGYTPGSLLQSFINRGTPPVMFGHTQATVQAGGATGSTPPAVYTTPNTNAPVTTLGAINA